MNEQAISKSLDKVHEMLNSGELYDARSELRSLWDFYDWSQLSKPLQNKYVSLRRRAKCIRIEHFQIAKKLMSENPGYLNRWEYDFLFDISARYVALSDKQIESLNQITERIEILAEVKNV